MDEHVCLLVCYLSRWIGYLLCKLTGGLGVNIFFWGWGDVGVSAWLLLGYVYM